MLTDLLWRIQIPEADLQPAAATDVKFGSSVYL